MNKTAPAAQKRPTEREIRAGAALRENLRKRKQQAELRQSSNPKIKE